MAAVGDDFGEVYTGQAGAEGFGPAEDPEDPYFSGAAQGSVEGAGAVVPAGGAATGEHVCNVCCN
jgi:hypothetical protein